MVRWRDSSASGSARFEERVRRAAAEVPPPLGSHLHLGPDFAGMVKNEYAAQPE